MRIHEQIAFADGDIISSYELVAEFANIFGGLNGCVDRDNILVANRIGRGKFKEGKLSATYLKAAVNASFIIRTETMDGQAWLPVADLKHTLTTGDTSLVLTSQVDGQMHRGPTPTATGGAALQLSWEIGIKVDGKLIARSDTSGAYPRQSRSVEGVAFVGAGEHTVQTFMRISPGGGPAPGTNHNVLCRGRMLLARPRIR